MLPFPMTRDIVDRFELSSKCRIGGGGWGTIYKARYEKRNIAIKQSLGTTIENSSLEREAKFLLGLNHPNITKGYAWWRQGDTHYLAMERCVGDAGRCIDLKRMTTVRALYVAQQIAQGLNYMHDRRLLHLDVKPDNILLSHLFRNDLWPRVKLTDFALARRFGEDLEVERRGTVFGTPEYLDPQRLLGHNPKPRHDIYSLGATLYELIGDPLFPDGVDMDDLPRIDDVWRSFMDDLDATSEVKWMIENMVMSRGKLKTASSVLKYMKEKFVIAAPPTPRLEGVYFERQVPSLDLGMTP